MSDTLSRAPGWKSIYLLDNLASSEDAAKKADCLTSMKYSSNVVTWPFMALYPTSLIYLFYAATTNGRHSPGHAKNWFPITDSTVLRRCDMYTG